MNLYMYLSDNLKKPHEGFNIGEWECSLEDFRKIINCPDTYDAQAIKNKILLPAKTEFENKKTIILFTHTDVYDSIADMTYVVKNQKVKFVKIKKQKVEKSKPTKTNKSKSAKSKKSIKSKTE